MLDLRPFLDPKTLNQSVSPSLRWPLAVILGAGSGLCLGIAVDTLRHWGEQPHPAFQFAFVAAAGLGAAALAVKLFRGQPIAAAVQRPPRPIVVRILGFVAVILCGPAVLISSGWLERTELLVLTLGGVGWLLAPKLFFPPRTGHGA